MASIPATKLLFKHDFVKCQTGISPIRLSCAGRNPYAGQDKTDDGIVLYGADQVGKDEAGLKR